MCDLKEAEEGQRQCGMTVTLSLSRNGQSNGLLGSTHVMSGMKYLELCSRPDITDVISFQRRSVSLTEEYEQRE